ncbi:MAG: sigma 54-interacting transcriptional regulator [Planctomycetes bacterium]|nr:sigma 54-interacting transcriptional regulator [Planctomycetota bacterium]
MSGDWRILRPLARGGQGEIYLAEGPRGRAALKVYPKGAEATCRAEYALRRGLVHPHLAEALAAGLLEDGRPYLASEFIQGPDLLAATEGATPLEVARLAAGVLRALARLHFRGVVHRDVRPENVLVHPERGAILVDLGLADVQAPGEATQGAIAGHPLYMAPEVLAARNAGPRADLYSLGQTLRHCLSRTAPFPGATPREVLRNRVAGGPPVALPPKVPSALAEVVERLSAPAPADRYASASDASRALAAATGLGLVVETPLAGDVPLAEPAFVGRGPERAALEAALAAGRPRLALLCGEPGSGRRRLAREVGEALRASGGRFLDLGEEGGLEGLARALGGRVEAVGGLKVGEAARLCVETARRHPLLVLAEPDAPGRALSREVLALEGEEARWVLGLRSTPAEPAPDGALVLDLAPLGGGELGALAASVIGGSPDVEELGKVLARRFAGSPLAAVEALRGLAEAGAIAYDEEGRPRVDLGAVERLSGGAAGVLLERASGLEPPIREALRRAALSPEGAPPELVGEPEAVAELVRRGLVEPVGAAPLSPPALRVPHPALREALVAEIPPETRAEAHRAMARALGARGAPARVVAPHLAAAGERGAEAAEVLAEAARDGERRGDAAGAMALWEAAAQAEPRPARRAACWESLGDLATQRGELDAADAALGRSLEGARGTDRSRRLRKAAVARERRGDRAGALEVLARALEGARGAERVEVEVRTAFLLQASGHAQEAERLARATLRRARREGASARALCALGLALTDLRRFDEALEALGEGAGRAEAAGESALAPVFAMNRGNTLLRAGRPAEALPHLEAAAALYETAGELPSMGRAANNLGAVRFSLGDLEGAGAAFERARSAYRRLGDPRSEADVEANLAAVAFEQDDYLAATRHGEQALSASESGGDRTRAGAALVNLASTALELGEVERARGLARRLRDLAAAGPGGEALASASRLVEGEAARRSGDLALARRHLAAALKGYEAAGHPRGACEAALRLALAEAASGRGGAALAAAGDARRRAEGQGAAIVASTRLAQARALTAANRPAEARSVLEEGPAPAGPRRLRAELEEAAAEAARAAGDLARARRHEREARALREALAEELPGDARQRYLAAHAPAGAEGVGDPGAAGTPPGAGSTLALRRLLEINREIYAETDLRRLLVRIVDAGIELTGAERGFIILMERGGRRFEAARAMERSDIPLPEYEVSHSIAEEVFRDGRSVVTADARSDAGFDRFVSVHQLSLRSIVCVPLGAKGQALGTVYLDHRGRAGAFDESDLHTLEALAEQAAIAIRNARRQSELSRARRRVERLHRALRRRYEAATAELAEVRAAAVDRYGEMVGGSEPMRALYAALERVAPTTATVLIEGESGTGKELVARAVHARSARAEGPFVSESCAAIAETLLEAELFGHARGAFTGATRDRPGLFERADGGTLFLDEVGEMSPALQGRLLRVVETGEVRPVGGGAARRVDARLVCATHRDLAALVRQGAFREDLYYRLRVVNLRLPPLRERREDVPVLARHFLETAAAREDRPVPRLERDTVARLVSHDWPGNVRELRNAMEKALALLPAGRRRLRAQDLDLASPGAAPAAGPGVGPGMDLARYAGLPYKEARDLFVRDLGLAALARSGGNVSRAARELGLGRQTFQQVLRRSGIGGTPSHTH